MILFFHKLVLCEDELRRAFTIACFPIEVDDVTMDCVKTATAPQIRFQEIMTRIMENTSLSLLWHV